MRKKRTVLRISTAVLSAVCVMGVALYGTGAERTEAAQGQEAAAFSFGKPGETQETSGKEESSGETAWDGTANADDDENLAALTSLDIAEIPLQEESEHASLPDITEVAKTAMPAIVAITNAGIETIDYFGMEYQLDSESSGSGIIIGQNDEELLIATNNHVVEGAEELTVCFSAEVEDEEERLVPAQVKGTDSSWDLAVVAVRLEDISEEVADEIGIIQMGDSDAIEVGEWAVAIGNALGYGQSVTFGIISALDREVSVSTENGVVTNNMLQTDAAINFGNSGGALLNLQGELIGINSAKAARSGVEGMGYAIPINKAKPIIEELMNQVTRTKVDTDKAGALGIVPVDVSEEARQIYNIPNGAFVYELTENSAAEKAGIRQGDIITKLDKTGISSKSELLNRMQYYEAGETVEVTVLRTGSDGYEEKVIEVVLGRKADLPDYNEDEEDDEYEEDDQYDGGNEDWQMNPYGGGSGLEEFFRYFGF